MSLSAVLHVHDVQVNHKYTERVPNAGYFKFRVEIYVKISFNVNKDCV